VAVICRPSDACITAQTHCRGLQRFNSVKTCIILVLLLLLLLFSLFLFTLLRLYLEIRDIWRPGAGLAGTWDSMALIRDIPGNPGRVASLRVRGTALRLAIAREFFLLFLYARISCLLLWAYAHRGKWGQLTPWKMDEKLKIESMQKRAVFYVYVIF